MSLTKKQISEIRLRLNNGEKGCDLAKEFGVSNSYVSQIKSKKRGTKQVWLTVEEAKSINEAIEWLCSTLEDYERDYDSIPALIEGWNQMDFLEHRIEQVSKQST